MTTAAGPSKSPARTMLAALGAACLLALPCLPGCKSRRAESQGPARLATATAEGPRTPARADKFDAFDALGYRPEWIGYAVVPTRNTVRFVDAYADIVVVHESGNRVTVMDAATGSNRWMLDLGSDLTRFVGNIRHENGDLLCSSQGEVFVLDSATGVLKDRQRLGVIANTRPVQIGSLLIYGCPTGEVMAHNLSSGYKFWGYMLQGSVTAPPVLVNGHAAAVSQGGELVILDRTGAPVGGGRIFGGLHNEPVAGPDTVYLAGADQSLWAFGFEQRTALWRYRSERPFRHQPVLHEGGLFVTVPGEGLSRFDAATGARGWTASGIEGEVAAVRAGRLVVWEGSGVISLLDPKRGDVLERFRVAGIDMLRTDRFVDGNLYGVGRRGEVQKYSPKR